MNGRRATSHLGIAVIALFGGLFGGGSSAKIHGHLHLPTEVARASYGPRAPVRGMMDAVVYIDTIPAKVERKLMEEKRDTMVVQVDQHFVPRVMTVAVGTRVRFQNMDRVYHNVFSRSPTKQFEAGNYGPGQSRTVKFERPGIVTLYCAIDPEESGYVFVTPNHAFLKPDPSGGFEFPKLPRGIYVISYWHPRYGLRSRTVEIPKRGDLALDLKF